MSCWFSPRCEVSSSGTVTALSGLCLLCAVSASNCSSEESALWQVSLYGFYTELIGIKSIYFLNSEGMIGADFCVFPSTLIIFLKQLQMLMRLDWMRSKEFSTLNISLPPRPLYATVNTPTRSKHSICVFTEIFRQSAVYHA